MRPVTSWSPDRPRAADGAANDRVAMEAMTTETDNARVQLDIAGMTCASCATRIERKLNRLDGVTATVNYATEQASVEYPRALSPRDLVAVVEAAGYHATVPAPRAAPEATNEASTTAPGQAIDAVPAGGDSADSAAEAAAALLLRLTTSAGLA